MALGSEYRKLWSASAISNLGDGARLTALPLLAAALTRDPALVAGVALATRLPWSVLPLVGGAVVDRVDRRRLMVWMQFIRMVAIGLLGAVALWERSNLPLLYSVALVIGVAEVFFDICAQSLLPAVVHKGQLERANGRLQGAEIVTNQFVGGPLGSALFAMGPGLPFLVDAASFAASGTLIQRLRGESRPRRTQRSSTVWADIKEGVRWLAGHRLLRTFAAMVGLMNMTYTAIDAILVLFALEILGLDAAAFGLLTVPLAVGSVVGTVLVDRLVRTVGSGRALLLSWAVMATAMLAVGLASDAIVVALVWALVGIFNMIWNVITVSLRQALVPDHLLGRINSVYRLLAWGTMPLGAALGGILSKAFGLRAPFLVGGALVLLLGALAIPIIASTDEERTRAEQLPEELGVGESP